MGEMAKWLPNEHHVIPIPFALSLSKGRRGLKIDSGRRQTSKFATFSALV
jgi:hypothetical protein